MVNWKKILRSHTQPVVDFAFYGTSGRELYDNFVYTEVGGEVRKLLRKRGVKEARKLAQKAIKRRGI